MELKDRAKAIIVDCLCLKQDETLLVVIDDPNIEIGKLFYQAAEDLGRKAALVRIPALELDGQEPPDVAAAAMCAADVALCPTSKSITHTNARIKAQQNGTRVVTMPGATLDMLGHGATCADYQEVEKLTRIVTDLLTKASSARIEKDGRVLQMSLAGRAGVPSPGVYRNPGECGNFPSGEAYIAPVEDGANGSVVIDGSMVGIGALEEPLIATLENGRLESLDGPHADMVDILFARPENGMIAELGIGTNKSAQLCGIILEDEKLYGTVHIAFGTNADFGGVTKADCHYDGIILKPTLYLDDLCVIKDGEFML